MDALLHWELIIKFLEYRNNPMVYDEAGDCVGRILYNPRNKFIFGNKYLAFINSELSTVMPAQKDIFQHLIIKKLHDQQRLRISTIEDDIDESAVLKFFNSLANKSKKHGFICLSFKYKTSKCAALHEASIPNSQWLKKELSTNSQLTVWPYNFLTDSDICAFFDEILNLCPYKADVYIQDDYCNIRQHTLFRKVAMNDYSIRYYVSMGRPKDLKKAFIKLRQLKQNLQVVMGKKAKLFFSFDTKMKHPRRILFNNLILKVDNDFPALNKSNNGWNIDVYDDHVTYLKIIGDLAHYRELK